MKTIVITGTHSVGKTSLCNQLYKELSGIVDVKIIPEMARLLISKGIQMNADADEYGIINYVLEYLRYSRENKAELVISDRSIFDLFAYISVSRSPEVRIEYVKLVEELVYQEIERVYSFIYVPIEFSLKKDGIRPNDVIYQKTIDNKVRELLQMYKARVLSVSGTIEQRVATVRDFLNV